MLLQLDNTVPIYTFSDLYTISLSMLQEVGDVKKTLVIGPVTSEDIETFKHNLQMLEYHSERLSNEGWAVLDLCSFQNTINFLVKKFNITRYPDEILHDFTLPLVESRVFNAIHVLKNYQESFGATLEHDKALGCDIPVIYIP